ncbi:MAG: Rrf2 family transcriptional regulator [Bacillota bacterium]
MKISSKLAMGIHVLIAIDRFYDKYKITSEFLAGSLQVNPVVVRQIMVGLNDAGITKITDRNKGVQIVKSLSEISMFDVYSAVDCDKKSMFGFHASPNEKCPVGGNIHNLLDERFDKIQEEFENSMKDYMLSDISGDLDVILGEISE